MSRPLKRQLSLRRREEIFGRKLEEDVALFATAAAGIEESVMDTIRGYVYRLKPTQEQDALFRRTAGVCRLIYNAALEQRSRWGKSHKLNAATVSRELKDLRAAFDWIGDVSQTAQAAALNDLDKAFQNFFSGRAGFPSPRRKGVNESFRFLGREVSIRRINRRWAEIRLPKTGWVRFRDTRKIDGEIRNVTVTLTPLGWHISVAVKRSLPDREALPTSVGIDRGVSVPVMLSTGEAHYLPEQLARVESRKRRAQKTLSRRKRGSKRYARARRRVASLAAKAARIRKHWQHELTTSLANRFGVVVLEKLKTKNMTKSAKGTAEEPGKNVAAKSGLNRAILNVGWFGIETKLAYKLAERGGSIAFVDASYTSQTCSCCGTVDAKSRQSQARFACVECGTELNADLNAAINIERRWNTPLQDVETKRKFVRETSTVLAAA